MSHRRDSQSRSTDRRFYGSFIGTVVDNEDPEKLGRVKLNLPWFDKGRSTSDWCRVAQTYAGPGYGSFWIPEVGSEVLVSLQHGDMRTPFVIGNLYNGEDKPATARTSDKDQKAFRTRAGHELVLDDTSDDRAIRLKTVDGHVAEFDDENRVIRMKSKDGHVMELSDDAKRLELKHTGGAFIRIEDGLITIEAKLVKINGDAKFNGSNGTRSLINGHEITGS